MSSSYLYQARHRYVCSSFIASQAFTYRAVNFVQERKQAVVSWLAVRVLISWLLSAVRWGVSLAISRRRTYFPPLSSVPSFERLQRMILSANWMHFVARILEFLPTNQPIRIKNLQPLGNVFLCYVKSFCKYLLSSLYWGLETFYWLPKKQMLLRRRG